MIERRIEEVTADDLQRLHVNGVAEGRSLEYKETLPGGTDSERKEFLADVSSFSNAIGGDLLYGLKEAREQNSGKPTGAIDAINGVDTANRDTDIQRLENMLRDGVTPRIPGVRFRWIDGFSNGPVLMVRIPKSWAGPHMVAFQQSSRFYSRNSNGKYQLDVVELRTAFLGSGSLSERAREFRAERLGRILADDAPVKLSSSKIICIHAIPHAALAGAVDVDIMLPIERQRYDLVYPFGSSGFDATTFNIDGLLSWNRVHDSERRTSYLQLFRSGVVETIDAAAIESPSSHSGDGIGCIAFAQRTFDFIHRVRQLWRLLDVEPPTSIFVSVSGAKGARLHVDYRRTGAVGGLFDRDQLLLPELLLNDFDGNVPEVCKPLLDVLWQASGFQRCLDYDSTGTWVGTP